MLFNKSIQKYIDPETSIVWYRAADVCRYLGFYWTNRLMHDYPEEGEKRLIATNGPSTWYLSEAGCYRIALASKTDSAKEFKRWLCQKVLLQYSETLWQSDL